MVFPSPYSARPSAHHLVRQDPVDRLLVQVVQPAQSLQLVLLQVAHEHLRRVDDVRERRVRVVKAVPLHRVQVLLLHVLRLRHDPCRTPTFHSNRLRLLVERPQRLQVAVYQVLHLLPRQVLVDLDLLLWRGSPAQLRFHPVVHPMVHPVVHTVVHSVVHSVVYLVTHPVPHPVVGPVVSGGVGALV